MNQPLDRRTALLVCDALLGIAQNKATHECICVMETWISGFKLGAGWVDEPVESENAPTPREARWNDVMDHLLFPGDHRADAVVSYDGTYYTAWRPPHVVGPDLYEGPSFDAAVRAAQESGLWGDFVVTGAHP